MNLHNTRVRRNPERLPSSRCIESAQSRSARVRILPIRASDTALRLVGSDLFEAGFWTISDGEAKVQADDVPRVVIRAS